MIRHPDRAKQMNSCEAENPEQGLRIDQVWQYRYFFYRFTGESLKEITAQSLKE